jgi:CRP/FNR family transcriptional regulator, cyclic AMP receptor protein
MQPEKLWYLRRMDIFSGLSDEEYRVIDRDSSSLVLRKRQLLPFQGTARQAVYFVKRGSIKLVRTSPDGHSFIIDILGPSTLFGELEGVLADDSDVTAEALEDTLLCMMRRKNFDRLMEMVPALGTRVTAFSGLRQRKIQNRLVDMLYSSVESRLAKAFLGLASEFGVAIRDGVLIDLRLTHNDFACLIASTRETVSAVLNSLSRRGVIEFRDHRVLLKDPERVKRVAGCEEADQTG